MNNKSYFNLSESFYSVQAEGDSTGTPSYFIRLSNCNFQCGLKHNTLQKIRKLVKDGKDSYSQEVIDLMIPEGDATWVCDSIPVWVKGKKVTFDEIIEDWKKENIEDTIKDGIVHIIFTGGEPLMPVNQESVILFMNYYYNLNYVLPYVEVETNGTQYISQDVFGFISQINCSVKLSNSGHTKDQRIVPDALTRIMQHDNYWFKFVISSEEDIHEIVNDFTIPFNIPKKKVLLMPALSTQEEFHEKNRFILEMAKKYRFRATSRLHISAFNTTCGV